MATDSIGVLDAAFALNERKRSVAPDADTIAADAVPLVALGMDLDLDELTVCSALVAEAYAAHTEFHPTVLMKQTFQDGVLTGLLLAQLRAEKEAA